MPISKASIDTLIEIVKHNGCVKTGIDVYNQNDVLLLDKNAPVSDVNILLTIKKNGIL